jgi:shikimate dehydrogenase
MFPLPPLPGGKSEMDILINQLRSMELQGVNVTIPHKRSFLPFLDELTPAARAVGAVNTLYFTGEKLVGENTDVPGFIGDLNAHLPSALGDNALVLGAGGAARAVVYALINHGWQVYVSARNPDQAQELANSFAHLIPSPVAFTLPLHDIAISLIGV